MPKFVKRTSRVISELVQHKKLIKNKDDRYENIVDVMEQNNNEK